MKNIVITVTIVIFKIVIIFYLIFYVSLISIHPASMVNNFTTTALTENNDNFE